MTDRYLFLCNQKRVCKVSTICGGACTHTLNEEFAKNKPEDRIFETENYYHDGDDIVFTHWEVEK